MRNSIHDTFDERCHSTHIGTSTPERTEDEIKGYIGFNKARMTGTCRQEGQAIFQFPTSGEIGGDVELETFGYMRTGRRR